MLDEIKAKILEALPDAVVTVDGAVVTCQLRLLLLNLKVKIHCNANEWYTRLYGT